jgi:transposase
VAASVWAVRDELWQVFRELLPHREPRATGRPRVPERTAFNAVVYVLVTGIAWRHLPREFGCSPATAHRRFQEWQRAGLLERLHQELLRRLNAAGRIDWSRGVIDGSHVRALEGGVAPGRLRLTAPARAPSTTC